MKVIYTIVRWHQVLLEGTWEDGDWDWEYDEEIYEDEESARRVFGNLEIDENTPIIRLYKVYKDEYGSNIEEEVLDEIS